LKSFAALLPVPSAKTAITFGFGIVPSATASVSSTIIITA
jgi:hypothetical protein